MADYSLDTFWESGQDDQQEVVVELDRVYQGKQAVLCWGEERASAYTMAVSVNGTDYATVKEVTEGSGEKDEIGLNGDMEAEDGWEFKDASENQTGAYAFAYDTDAHSGKSSAKITRTGEGEGDGQLAERITLEPNKRYQLSFWHKSDSLNSGAFAYEINQKDKDGNTISTHLAKLADNLNMSKEYRQFTYNFITSPYTDHAEIVFHVLSGEGSLWLDDVCVREVIPTENVFVSCDKLTLKVGETAKAAASILPENADDITFHWESSDLSVVDVDNEGNVNGAAEGKAYIGLVSDSDLIAESWILVEVKK